MSTTTPESTNAGMLRQKLMKSLPSIVSNYNLIVEADNERSVLRVESKDRLPVRYRPHKELPLKNHAIWKPAMK